MKLKQILFALLISVVTIFMASLAIKSFIFNREKKELQKAKEQVHENFKKPYTKSDSAVSTTPKTDIGSVHSEVEARRFPK